MSKPTLFIGSSSEGLKVARAVHSELRDIAAPQTWSQGVFGMNESGLEALLRVTSEFDFAILIATADDVATARGVASEVPRDNVLFELGLFYGALGRDRTFLLVDTSSSLKLPSDLDGITREGFDVAEQPNLQAVVAPACDRVRQAIETLGSKRPVEFKAEVSDEVSVRVVKGDIAAFDRPGTTLLLPSNDFFDTTAECRLVESASSLGAVLEARKKRGGFDALDKALENELKHLDAVGKGPKGTPAKPGRQRQYSPGTCLRIPGEPSDVILGVTSTIERQGSMFYAKPFEERFDQVLASIWKQVGKVKVRDELAVPLLGSGFLGMRPEVVLVQLLESFGRAQKMFGGRICNKLTVVVYQANWGDGEWVSRGIGAAEILALMGED